MTKSAIVNIIAVIPARGGSKRIPRKNIRYFAGKPMLMHALQTAKLVDMFSRIVVSSDDQEILDCASGVKEIEIIHRPTLLTDDYCSTISVIRHAIKVLKLVPDTLVCCLYPTIPLLTIETLKVALQQAVKLTSKCHNPSAIYAIRPFNHPPERALYYNKDDNNLQWLDPSYAMHRTQDLPKLFHDVGQFYIQTAARWCKNKDVINQGKGILLTEDEAIDIDTEEDWHRAERLYSIKYNKPPSYLASNKILFRVDANYSIGSGHLMRCLTLANALKENKFDCHFLCHDIPNKLINLILNYRHNFHLIPKNIDDIKFSSSILQNYNFAWVIVDHYELGLEWESIIPETTKLMVIDDLADRPHHADLLLNQNLYSKPEDYIELVPKHCKCLCGSKYALLRPDFEHWRAKSMQYSAKSDGSRILINFGGIDKDNFTTLVINHIRHWLPNIQLAVLMGFAAPHTLQVQHLAQKLSIECYIGIDDIAALLSEYDWVIGSAGSSLWERCCLGIPSLLLIQADNQIAMAKIAKDKGFGQFIADLREPNWSTKLYQSLSILQNQTQRLSMSISAAAACDGFGITRVLNHIIRKHYEFNLI